MHACHSGPWSAFSSQVAMWHDSCLRVSRALLSDVFEFRSSTITNESSVNLYVMPSASLSFKYPHCTEASCNCPRKTEEFSCGYKQCSSARPNLSRLPP